MKEAADKHIQKHKHVDRNFEYSEEITQMMKRRQDLKDIGAWDEVKKQNSEIRKKMVKEKSEQKIKHLEEELWYDIKKAKTSFVPAHKNDGREWQHNNFRPKAGQACG